MHVAKRRLCHSVVALIGLRPKCGVVEWGYALIQSHRGSLPAYNVTGFSSDRANMLRGLVFLSC